MSRSPPRPRPPRPRRSASESSKPLSKTQFLRAVAAGDAPVVELGVSLGFHFENFRGVHGGSAAHAAARAGQPAILARLLDAGCPLDAPDSIGCTPLLVACSVDALAPGASECAILLIKRGADVHARSEEGWTSLAAAALAGRDSVVESLLRAGADPDSSETCGDTALIDAVIAPSPACVRLLLDAGASLDARGQSGMTALAWASELSGPESLESSRLLVAAGADIHALDDDGRAPLSLACGQGAAATARLLLDSGADLWLLDAEGLDALAHACGGSSPECAQMLLEAGADPDRHDPKGSTPLIRACQSIDSVGAASARCCSALLAAGADPNRATDAGETALFWAARFGLGAAAGVLLRAGALQTPTFDGTTPLMAACEQDCAAVARLLLKRGGDADARDTDGNTALIRASLDRAPLCARVLLAAGADIDAANLAGRTAWTDADGATRQALLEARASRELSALEASTPSTPSGSRSRL